MPDQIERALVRARARVSAQPACPAVPLPLFSGPLMQMRPHGPGLCYVSREERLTDEDSILRETFDLFMRDGYTSATSTPAPSRPGPPFSRCVRSKQTELECRSVRDFPWTGVFCGATRAPSGSIRKIENVFVNRLRLPVLSRSRGGYVDRRAGHF